MRTILISFILCISSNLLAQEDLFGGVTLTKKGNTMSTSRGSTTSTPSSYNQGKGNSNSSNTNRQSGNVAYLDILNRYSSYDKTPKIERPIVKSKKVAWTNNKGFRYEYYYDNGWRKILLIGTCMWCSGKGRRMSINPLAGVANCGDCHGSGTSIDIELVNFDIGIRYNRNGDMFFLQDTSGGGSVGGNSVSDEYSGSSSSRSSSSRSTKSTDKGVDVIEYGPNYTGSGTKYWCDKCQAYKERHIHKTIK